MTGTCGRGRRPRRPAPGAGRPAVRPGAWGRAGARDARPYQRRGPHAPRPTCGGGVGGVGTAATSAALPHDAARFHFGTHVFPHPATRCCKMRFHRVIILKAVAPRGGFDTCGLPRGCLGGPGAARSGCVPGSCPSRACRDLHYIPVRSAGGRRHGPPPRKSGKEGERTVSLSTGKETPQDALLSTESIEVRHLVPKGFLSVRQTGICWFGNAKYSIRLYLFSFITLHGFPTAITLSGMSFVTTLPAPITTLSPIVTPGRMRAPPPIQTLSPIVTGAVLVLQNSNEPSDFGSPKRSTAFVG